MTSVVTPTVWDIALGVAAEMQAHTFSQPPQSVSAEFLHEFDLVRTVGLQFVVIPESLSIELLDRSLDMHGPAVHVGIQKKLSGSVATEKAQAAELIKFVTEVAVFFSRRRLSTVPAARWRKTESIALWLPDHLANHVFTSVLRVSYQLAANAGG